jgi:hypothetical protein
MYDSNSKGISYTAGFFILIGFAITGIIFGFCYQYSHMDEHDRKEHQRNGNRHD